MESVESMLGFSHPPAVPLATLLVWYLWGVKSLGLDVYHTVCNLCVSAYSYSMYVNTLNALMVQGFHRELWVNDALTLTHNCAQSYTICLGTDLKCHSGTERVQWGGFWWGWRCSVFYRCGTIINICFLSPPPIQGAAHLHHPCSCLPNRPQHEEELGPCQQAGRHRILLLRQQPEQLSHHQCGWHQGERPGWAEGGGGGEQGKAMKWSYK